ncbi:NADPH dehydrogenase [bacterium BMS3Abin05]|nr:NADPH dehydrogenase [bacterium BMS3Abin05]GBE28990.1 NADPH dehydrogenase [bacterium BMS3Bbin03]
MKFFTYKTADDLREHISALGLEIPLETHLKKVLEPVSVGGRSVGNALAIHPMEGTDSELSGEPGELTFRRWERYAAGGCKLFWGEATAVSEEGRANPRQLYLTETTYDSFARLVEHTHTVHRDARGDDSDFLLGLQITHSGRWSYRKPLIAVHNPLVDSVTFVDRKKGICVDESYPVLTDDYLESLEDSFLNAAKLASRAGFDFVDLKECHTYLLNELLGARTRAGKYGGSWENRTRFIRNVVKKIRETVPNVMIATRLNVFDGIPRLPEETAQKAVSQSGPPANGFGISHENPAQADLTEPLKLVSELKALGVKIVSVSMGSPYYNSYLERPMEKPAVGDYPQPEHPLYSVARHFEYTAAVQQAHPDVIILGAGYSWLRHFFVYAAEGNLRSGRVSIVGTGRGILAYPDMVKDLMETGRLNPRKACIADSHCTNLMRAKGNAMGQFPAGCATRDALYAKIYKQAY